VGNDRQFQKTCVVLDIEELLIDDRYKTNEARVRNRPALIAILSNVVKTNTKEHWMERLRNEGVPCAPINNIAEVFQDPQVIERKMSQELEHPLAGSVKTISNPIKFSKTPVNQFRHSPMLGQHTDEILKRFPSKAEM